jgi:hypothetical protein
VAPKLGKIGYSVGDATLEVRESWSMDLFSPGARLHKTGWTASVEHLVLKRFPQGAELPMRAQGAHFGIDEKGRKYVYRSSIALGRRYRTKAAALKAITERFGVGPDARWVEEKDGTMRLRAKGSKYPELKRWARWYLRQDAKRLREREKRIAARAAG